MPNPPLKQFQMNRIHTTLSENKKLLSIYFTAGFPHLNNTVTLIEELEKNGVDFIEIGLPFSDPLADGPIIQASSKQALSNGMTTEILFEQLQNIRKTVKIPLLIMGYFNPILQYGVEAFCIECSKIGIDGLIIPDLPLEIYRAEYEPLFLKYGLSAIFLVTPQTSDSRILEIDAASSTFIYLVSKAAVTGGAGEFGPEQMDYFKRIAAMNLKNPLITGFGISSKKTFSQASEHTKGAIIGSAFVNFITNNKIEDVKLFIEKIL